jgi:hypothetical protein
MEGEKEGKRKRSSNSPATETTPRGGGGQPQGRQW